MSARASFRRALTLPLQARIFDAAARLGRNLGALPGTRSSSGNLREILVVYLTDYLGDSVMMMPLLDRLHTALPCAAIDLAVGNTVEPIMRRIPYVRKVWGINSSKRIAPIFDSYLRAGNLFQFVRRELRGRSYDCCILPRWGCDLGMSKHLAVLTGVPVWGHRAADESLHADPYPGFERMYSVTCCGGHGLPESLREARLLETAGLIHAAEYEHAEHEKITAVCEIAKSVEWHHLRQELEIEEDEKYIAVATGASHPSRRWPIDFFGKLVEEAKRACSARVFLIGSASERETTLQLQESTSGGIISLAGKTSLTDTVALLAHAQLFVGNDSGPAHVAAGLGTPTLVLSACPVSSNVEHAGSPSRVRPIGPSVRILQPEAAIPECEERCTAAIAHCIKNLSVDQVLQELLMLWNTRLRRESLI